MAAVGRRSAAEAQCTHPCACPPLQGAAFGIVQCIYNDIGNEGGYSVRWVSLPAWPLLLLPRGLASLPSSTRVFHQSNLPVSPALSTRASRRAPSSSGSSSTASSRWTSCAQLHLLRAAVQDAAQAAQPAPKWCLSASSALLPVLQGWGVLFSSFIAAAMFGEACTASLPHFASASLLPSAPRQLGRSVCSL